MEGFEELPADAQIDPIPDGYEALPDNAQLEPVGATEVQSAMQGGFADSQPQQPLTKLSPEDEAAYRGIVAKGSVAQIQSFLHSRGMQSDTAALRKFVAGRDNANRTGGKVNYDPTYAMAAVPVSSTSDAVARGAVQGATLGFADELHGVAAGVGSALQGGSYNDAYNRTVDADRAAIGSDEENNYAASLAGNLAGGLLLPIGLERAGVTASTRAVGVAARDAAIAEGFSASAADRIAARAVSHRLAAEGAAYGGAYGAGSSEGDPGERLLSAGTGAVAGAVAGGIVLPALAKGAGYAKQGVRAALQPFTRSGAQDRAGELLGQAALRPIDDVLADIAGRETPASGAVPTLGEVAGDAGLAGFQRGFANTEQRAGAQVGERNASNAIARTRYASDAFGDGSPQAVQDYAGTQVAAGEAATVRQQIERTAAAEARLAGERGIASEQATRAETDFMRQREAIGQGVDRTATGASARDLYETNYGAARQRTSDAYNDPRLADNDPVSLRPAELADHYLPSQVSGDIGAFREEAVMAAKGALPPKPQSLLQFVRSRGGVLADGMGADDLRHSGLTSKAEPTLINGRGQPLDNHLEAAVEQGFVPEGTSLSDFAEEIANEHRGISRLVRPGDLNAAEDHAAAAENKRFWEKSFSDQGLNPQTMTDEQWGQFYNTMRPGADEGRSLFDIEAERSPGSVMGPFQKTLSGIKDQYFGDGATSVPADAASFFNDVMNADTVGIKTLEGWERRAYDMAARAPDRTTGAFLRGVGRVIGSKASAEGGPGRAAALRAARAARAEQGRVFETGDAPKAFARDRYNNPVVGDTTVPSKLVRPGAPGGDTADGLIAAVGAEPAETLVRQELRRAIEEGGVRTEQAAQGLLTRFGEMAKRFPGLQSDLQSLRAQASKLDAARAAETAASRATFTPAETASIRERSAFHDTIMASPLGKVADAATDPSSYVGRLLAQKDDGRQLRYLARQVADNDNALNGFRRALGDYIETAGAGPGVTLAGENIPAIAKTRRAIDAVLKRSGDAITPQQKMALKAVNRELTAANFAASAGRPLGSDTAMNQGLSRLIGRIPIGGVAKSVAVKIVSALGNENEVKRLLTQAILDPDFAATLLKRPTKQHLTDAADRIAGRKGIIPVANTINAGTQRMTGTNQ